MRESTEKYRSLSFLTGSQVALNAPSKNDQVDESMFGNEVPLLAEEIHNLHDSGLEDEPSTFVD